MRELHHLDDGLRRPVGRERVLTIMLPCLLAVAGAAGCSTMRTEAVGPIGCCCAYASCRAGLSEPECAKEGQFQGWTSTWHPGACTQHDTYPAPDLPAPGR